MVVRMMHLERNVFAWQNNTSRNESRDFQINILMTSGVNHSRLQNPLSQLCFGDRQGQQNPTEMNPICTVIVILPQNRRILQKQPCYSLCVCGFPHHSITQHDNRCSTCKQCQVQNQAKKRSQRLSFPKCHSLSVHTQSLA
jgi:hypothetical protein